MRSIFFILCLFFSFNLFAQKITNLKIEGISIGDSALDFFSKSHIKKNSYYYKSKKFTRVQNDLFSWFENFDAVDFHFKTGDQLYKIYSVSGIKFYDKNIEECYPFLEEITFTVNKALNTLPINSGTSKFSGDISGKSTFTQVSWAVGDGYVVAICYDYSKKYGGQDHFELAIDTPELFDFLANDAY